MGADGGQSELLVHPGWQVGGYPLLTSQTNPELHCIPGSKQPLTLHCFV